MRGSGINFVESLVETPICTTQILLGAPVFSNRFISHRSATLTFVRDSERARTDGADCDLELLWGCVFEVMLFQPYVPM